MSKVYEFRTRTWTVDTMSGHEIPDEMVCVLSAAPIDPRSRLAHWDERKRRLPLTCVEVVEISDESVTLEVAGVRWTALLRQPSTFETIFCGPSVCIDISGLPHHVWAPFVRAAVRLAKRVWVVYAEPLAYRVHPSPASPSVFHLSDSVSVPSPLPGFVTIASRPDEDEALFVPFLGFEGMRVRQIAFQLDPLPRAIPVIGVPGFQPQFPLYTVSCNREFLEDTRSYSEVRYVKASCPFAAHQALEDVSLEFPGKYLYVAPVGTKPHALGVVLYAIANPSGVEILYDHPVRSPGRTKGLGRVHIYRVKE